ncbi:hypothetical protein LK540_09905 [Massilia sp. IC2-278]|uniref:hypothetical protein n=1 Tax=Massilia sp. IC2-278 TaxID=2887200 RepID=UPI001E5A52BB|nr:hypothetical protein [Massilia sp. IC2-278]MCC2960738.1 hypothetical protein [Massilia sp. IC2-278]
MKTLHACLLSSLLVGCAGQAPSAPPAASTVSSPAQLHAMSARLFPYTRPETDTSRLPLATDTDVAWDEIAHRASMRWDCRALPSGKFVANSLCAAKPKIDSTWPGKEAPPGWSGVVFLD